VAEAIRRAPELDGSQTIIVNLSGRGDKDLETVINIGEIEP
jgi:tryptophan synthase beta subunit